MTIEDKLTTEQIATIHSFGDCWIVGYDKRSREMWEKALWLWSWDNKVEWSKERWNVPTGISSANHKGYPHRAGNAAQLQIKTMGDYADEEIERWEYELPDHETPEPSSPPKARKPGVGCAALVGGLGEIWKLLRFQTKLDIRMRARAMYGDEALTAFNRAGLWAIEPSPPTTEITSREATQSEKKCHE